jgi:hypothetical protein
MNDIVNPFGGDARPGGALANAEAQRAITEVQAALIVAHSMPRDQRRSMDLILQECTREGLAAEATYEYARGGTAITGASIRLAETVARNWGNLECGVKETTRHTGWSEAMSYAWDLQTNTREVRIFPVRHIRDTKQGPKPVTDERDIYELVANMGARRKRACIIALIPGDVFQTALLQCEATLKANFEVTPEFIAQMLERFAEYGITKAMIEAREQRRIESISPAAAQRLRRVYTSLKDGMSEPGEWFDVSIGAPGEKPAQRSSTEVMKEAMKARGSGGASGTGPAAKKTAPKAKAVQAASEPPAEAKGAPTYASIRDALEHAKSVAEVGAAGDAIARIKDDQQREELEAILDARLREFEEAERDPLDPGEPS